ncbi:hypothetical protein ANO11243_082060 [Dothideomycetidae sp. 11243]|nr:hypothetical protein ANO11243_082060 [fungal sp. No.11243]
MAIAKVDISELSPSGPHGSNHDDYVSIPVRPRRDLTSSTTIDPNRHQQTHAQRNVVGACFSRLPAELRLLIWHATLPDLSQPALVTYQKGCWTAHGVSPTDQSIYPSRDSSNASNEDEFFFQYEHRRLPWVEHSLPSAGVNREGRTVALTWAFEHGIKLCHRNGMLIRPFDPLKDILHIKQSDLFDFLEESNNLKIAMDIPLWDPVCKAEISRVSLTLAAIRSLVDANRSEFLTDMFGSYGQVTILYVIMDEDEHESGKSEEDVSDGRRSTIPLEHRRKIKSILDRHEDCLRWYSHLYGFYPDPVESLSCQSLLDTGVIAKLEPDMARASRWFDIDSLEIRPASVQ